MRGLPKLAASAMAWVVGKEGPDSITGIRSDSGNFLDVFRKKKAPNQKQLIEQYVGTVYACANLNATAVAATPLRLYVRTAPSQPAPKCPTKALSSSQKIWLADHRAVAGGGGGVEEIREVVSHPILDLINMANTELDGFSLIELTDLFQEIVGNAYWWLPKGILGTPKAIWLLIPHLLSPKKNAEGKLTHYEYGSGARKMKLPAEDVLAFRFPNLKDIYGQGWSPARAVYESIDLLRGQSAYALSMVENRARPDLLIAPEEPLGIAETERLEKRISRKFRKGGSGGVLVLDEKFRVMQIAIKPKDLEMLALHGVGKTTIANAYGVPTSLLETKEVPRANVEGGLFQFAKFATLPRCTRMDQRLSQRFTVLWDSRLFLAFDNPVPDDIRATAMIQNQDLKSGVRTINEVRAEKGLPKAAWGEEPWFVQTLAQPSGMVAPKDKPSSVPTADPEDGDDDEKMFDLLVSMHTGTATASDTEHALRTIGMDADAAQAAVRKVKLAPEQCYYKAPPALPGHNRGWKVFQAVLKDVFEFQKAEVFSWISLRLGSSASVKDTTPGRLFPDSLDQIDLAGMGLDESMAAKVFPHIEIRVIEGAKNAQDRIAYATDFVVAPAKLQEAADQLALKFSQATNRTTSLQLQTALQNLRRDLAEGIVSGPNTIPELTKRVNAVFDQASASRAERIAITESSRAVHAGRLIVAKDSGVVRGFRWVASSDACPLCLGIVAETPEIPLEGSFRTIGEGHYSTTPHPPAHPYCMCTVTEVIGDATAPEPEPDPSDADKPSDKPKPDPKLGPKSAKQTADEMQGSSKAWEQEKKSLSALKKQKTAEMHSFMREQSALKTAHKEGLLDAENLARQLKALEQQAVSRGKEVIQADMKMRAGTKAIKEQAREMLFQDVAGKMETPKNALGVFTSGPKKKSEQAATFINRIVGQQANGILVDVRMQPGRAYYLKGTIHMDLKAPVSHWVHEIGHVLEEKVPGMRSKIWAYRKARTAGEDLVPLNKLVRKGYADNELTRRDKWMDPYWGKHYKSGDTEILSMALQSFFEDPLTFLKKDRETFEFVLGLFR